MTFFEIMKGTNLLIFFSIIAGGVIVTGYTAVQHYNSVKTDLEADKLQVERDSIENVFRGQIAKKNQEIIDLQKTANDKLNETNKKSEELVEVYKSLNEANTKIQKIQNESIKMITGEGVPIIEVANFARNQYSVTIVNNSNYPLYDVEISVVDVDVLFNLCPFAMHEGIPYGDTNCLASNLLKFSNQHNIRQQGGVVLDPLMILKEGLNNLQFTVHARHKSYLYRYVIKKDNEIIRFEYRVYDLTNTERPEVFRYGNLNISNNYWDEKFLPLNIRYSRVMRPDEKP